MFLCNFNGIENKNNSNSKKQRMKAACEWIVWKRERWQSERIWACKKKSTQANECAKSKFLFFFLLSPVY